jgi:hypothetical protein
MRDRKLQIEQQLAALQAELTMIRSKLFVTEAEALFANHPAMESFSWTQYTPYFNDGAACEFDVHRDGVEINDAEVPDRTTYVASPTETEFRYGRSMPRYVEVPNPAYDPALTAAQKAVAAFLEQFDSEQLQEMFGDHARIRVTRAGATVDEYSHD